jgi:hypothetical protein
MQRGLAMTKKKKEEKDEAVTTESKVEKPPDKPKPPKPDPEPEPQVPVSLLPLRGFLDHLYQDGHVEALGGFQRWAMNKSLKKFPLETWQNYFEEYSNRYV